MRTINGFPEEDFVTAKRRNTVHFLVCTFFSILLAELLVIAILLVDIALWIRGTMILLLLAPMFITLKVYQATRWEGIARRSAAKKLVFFGSVMLSRGIAGLVFAVPELKAKIAAQSGEHGGEFDLCLTVMTGLSFDVNLFLLIAGVICLLSVLYFKGNTIPSTDEASFVSDSEPAVPNSQWSNGIEPSLFTYDSDLPPLVDAWVGRESELDLISEQATAVIALTGIGGQGKSALAAKALQDFRLRYPNDFWDWRDCREQSDRFRTQLLSALYRLTHGAITPRSLCDVDINWLAKYFFQKAQGIRGFIVFDNVDFYTNVETSYFTDEISVFVAEALRVDHGLTIVFTCRPRVAYSSHRFRDILLRGLSPDESVKLFRSKLKGRFDEELVEMLPEFCERCEGHPLWLNIIASQVSRKPETAKSILQKLRGSVADARATAMLNAVWDSLKEEQQKILEYMSELPKAITEDEIAELLKEEFQNRNRFTKSFRALVQISLVTEKHTEGTTLHTFDLHPLVRTYVRKDHRGPSDRSQLIIRILVWCNTTIVQLSDASGIPYLERLMMRAELEFNSGQQDKALKTIVESYSALVTEGLHEEFIRLGRLVLNSHTGSWKRSTLWGSANFHAIVNQLIRLLLEIDRVPEAKEYMAEYEAAVDKGTTRYRSCCDIQAYLSWFEGDFVSAISAARSGQALAAASGADSEIDCSHHLALALRDSGQADGMDEAIKIFSSGKDRRDILTVNYLNSDRQPDVFGNLGRCFQLGGELDRALAFLSRSFELLTRQAGAERQMNLGYAALWLGECLNDLGRNDEAEPFLHLAVECWRTRAPKRAEEALKSLIDFELNLNTSESDLEFFCSNWIRANQTDRESLLTSVELDDVGVKSVTATDASGPSRCA